MPRQLGQDADKFIRTLKRLGINDVFYGANKDHRKRSGPLPVEHLGFVNIERTPFLLAPIPPGIAVLDIDDEGALDTWSEIMGCAIDEDTLTTISPRGRHLWYRLPTGLVIPRIVGLLSDEPLVIYDAASDKPTSSGEPTSERSPNVDLLTGSGYVVVPPSAGYHFVDADAELAFIPPGILDEAIDTLFVADGDGEEDGEEDDAFDIDEEVVS